MRRGPNTRMGILVLAAIAAPPAAVVGVRFLGSASAVVSGAPLRVEADPISVIELNTLRGDARGAAIASRSAALADTDVGSPFAAAPVDRPEQPVDVVEAERRPSIVLTAILPNKRAPLAVVDGRPHGIGDVVRPGWRLDAIDGAARTITVRHESGARAVIPMTSD